ncbi:aminodeoxychorismate/anthranilate synthase component II [Halobacteriovorax sp. HLS]|uniref:aminodeoxychorismate/anthranilate synthase component II n=1 Tax=Halobacteriovorax sp. HLS TaxID=2234000 RepID=UPI0013E332F5|nr:aminodeoxychorismate/anthranilate synthase component II [Halobacteriovorax sp. HLS]
MKVLIIDFADSFTFNIYNEFLCITQNVEVVSYLEFSKVDYLEFDIICLGPGPGIVNEYSSFTEFTKLLIAAARKSQIHLLGICLGHQLIHIALDRSITQLENPIHGQQRKISFNDHKILNTSLKGESFLVQHYNSWAIVADEVSSIFSYELSDSEGLLLASFSENITTYQFHPESVGTSCPKAFFKQCLV